MAFIWKTPECIVIHKSFILYPIHFKPKYFTDLFGHFLPTAVFPYTHLQLRWTHSIFQMALESFRGSHSCCLVTCCWGTITTYRGEFTQSQIRFGSGARDNYHLRAQNWMQWFWYPMSLTLIFFPSTYFDELCRYMGSRSGDWPGWKSFFTTVSLSCGAIMWH